LRTLRDLSRAAWPDASELRIGLGCMRLSTDEARDEDRALETITAAVQAGITVFDTARAYGHGPDELGHNERLLARALRSAEAAERARIVTKGGMTRAGGGWIADGRAKAIRADCEASLEALDGIPIDLYLIHAPDPRTPWSTSVRALARLVDDGVVRRVGIANVNRRQLDEALDHAPIAAVQVALNPFDDSALRGGVLERCVEREIALLAHSPLGGPRRAGSVDRQQALVDAAESHGVTPAEVALAWLLELSPVVVPIPGARRPETVRSAARAAALELDDADRATLAAAFGGARPAPASSRSAAGAGEVVVVMGIPGSGKSHVAEEYVERGYVRLNRDERGGSLRALAEALDEELASRTRRLVLDNTYLTRASRSYVVEAAARHGVPARCVWLDTPLAQAQVNVVKRLLERFGSLPTPEEVRDAAKREPGIHAPTTQMRTLRELEPPADDEGFAIVERIEFERTAAGGSAGAVFVAAPALRQPGWEQAIDKGDLTAPHLVYDWDPDGAADALAAPAAALAKRVSGPIETALCPHPAGPPVCWCRPPLPGLALAFTRAHNLDPARSTLIGNAPAHRTLATTLGARFVEA
jgi:aryl-alcohol dehydrogenase-like predicted oxidoreductase/predicted kinase